MAKSERQEYEDYLRYVKESENASKVDEYKSKQKAPSSQVDEYLASQKAAAMKSGSTEEEWKQYEQSVRDKEEKKLGDYAQEAGIGAFDYTMRGLDYLGGLGRTGVGAALGANPDWDKALAGKAESGDEILAKAGMDGQGKLSDIAPNWLYSDTGEGLLTLQRGGMFDPTARGTAGLALEIAADPTTYASGGIVKAGSTLAKLLGGGIRAGGKLGALAAANYPKLAKAIDGSGKVVGYPLEWAGKGAAHVVGGEPLGFLKPIGKQTYKWAFTNIDQAAAKKRKDPVSDLLWENNIKGTTRQVADQSIELANRLEKERDGVFNKLDGALLDADAGPTLSVKTITETKPKLLSTETTKRDISVMKQGHFSPNMNEAMRGADLYVDSIAKNDATKHLAADMRAYVNHVKNFTPPTFQQASDYKSALYNQINGSQWDKFAQVNEFQRLKKIMAGGIKKEVETKADNFSSAIAKATGTPDQMSGKKIKELNDKWGRLLSTAKVMDNEAGKAERKAYWTQVDPMVAAFGFIGGNTNPVSGAATSLGALAGKKLSQGAYTTFAKTHAGKGLYNLGDSKTVNNLFKRGMIHGYDGSLWDLLGEDASGVLPRPNKEEK